jgi:ABC-2 type transport system permease protein
MVGSLRKYFRSWIILTNGSTQLSFQSRFGASLFIVAKLLRYVFFLYFLFLLLSKTNTLAGYTLWQVILFYASYNLIDTLSQLLFRNVYRFRAQIINGYFDYILLRPLSPLFKTLFGGVDLLDLPLLIISLIFIIIAFASIEGITLVGALSYILLLANSLLIALSIHILVLALGILSTTVDNAVMLYRDIVQMGRVPIELYLEPLRGFITFIIPVGIMMSFPPKALFGLLSPALMLYAALFSIIFLLLSIRFWHFSLKRYQSASS